MSGLLQSLFKALTDFVKVGNNSSGFCLRRSQKSQKIVDFTSNDGDFDSTLPLKCQNSRKWPLSKKKDEEQ